MTLREAFVLAAAFAAATSAAETALARPAASRSCSQFLSKIETSPASQTPSDGLSSARALVPAPSRADVPSLATGRSLATRSAPSTMNIAFRPVAAAPSPIVRSGYGVSSAMSPSGRTAAFVQGTGARGMDVVAVDLASGTERARARFDDVQAVLFLADESMVVVGRPPGKDRREGHVFRLAPAPASAAEREPLPVPRETALVASASARLDLPEPRFHGPSLDQIVARPDLPSVVALRRSTQPLQNVYRPHALPTVDRWTSLMNYGATLHDPTTLARRGELAFGDLRPVAAALNPRSTLIAFVAMQPLASERANDSVFVVDARDPSRIVFQHAFGNGGVDWSLGGRAYTQIQNQIDCLWSEDGESLLIVEKTTGSIVRWNARTGAADKDVRRDADAWPIAGALALNGGGVVVLRQTMEERARPDHGVLRATGFTVGAGAALDFERAPDFKVEIDFAGLPEANGREDSPFGPGSFSRFFSMRNGAAWAFVFGRHVIAFNAADPRDYAHGTAAHSVRDGHRTENNEFVDAIKTSDRTIRVADALTGVYDVELR